MRLVVAEKPSVARDLAAVLGATRKGDGCLEGDGVRVTWCVGHLVELEEPAHYNDAWRRWSLEVLPMLPDAFALRVREDAKAAFGTLRGHLRDRSVKEVVNACDAGREGELIFRWVYELAGCRAPVQRLWTSSLTPDAIRVAFRNLRPSADFDRLGDAARSRAESDWLVGMNATRAMTSRSGGDLLSVGRVQTPTLAMIVGRDAAIAAFVPSDYWVVHLQLSSAPGPFRATWFAGDAESGSPADDEAPTAERLEDKEVAEALAVAVANRPGVVTHADRRTKRELPPFLYDLTSLQRRANQRYGLSATRTLEVAQALYERHKLLTYPRTDARHLGPAEAALLPGVLRAVGALAPYRAAVDALLAAPLRLGKRIVDAAEVGDHHAILPTDKIPDAARLNPDEKRIYDLVVRRLLAALSPDAVFDTALVVVEIDAPRAPVPPLFRARGRVERVAGWRAVDPPGSSREVVLPAVDKGDAVVADTAEAAHARTRPPKPHDDASLLGAMETAGKSLDDEALRRALRGAGLGTPATRAAVLQTLVDRQYVVREARALRATPKGVGLIGGLPVEELKNAELTGRWEARLFAMAEGRESRVSFIADVHAHVRAVVASIAAAPMIAGTVTEGEVVGACPQCGKDVRTRRSGWVCSATCGFSVPRRIAKRELSDRMMQQILRGQETATVKGWKSKAGKEFVAGLRWDSETHKVAFVFPKLSRPTAKLKPVAVGDPCPTCKDGTVLQGREKLGCSRWRQGCPWRSAL